jgi:hypothetical protein
MARIPPARRAGGVAAMPGWRSGFGGCLSRGAGADPATRCRGCAVCCGARRICMGPREREGERPTESSGGVRRPRATLALRRRCAVFRWGAVMQIRVGAFARVVGVGTFGRWEYVGAVDLECGHRRGHCSTEEACRRGLRATNASGQKGIFATASATGSALRPASPSLSWGHPTDHKPCRAFPWGLPIFVREEHGTLGYSTIAYGTSAAATQWKRPSQHRGHVHTHDALRRLEDTTFYSIVREQLETSSPRKAALRLRSSAPLMARVEVNASPLQLSFDRRPQRSFSVRVLLQRMPRDLLESLEIPAPLTGRLILRNALPDLVSSIVL